MASPQRPHIVLTIADDQRFDMVGALGHPTLRTPTLDGMCRRGTAFIRAHHLGSTHGAVCAPSRAMLHTGLSHYVLPQELRGHMGAFNPPARIGDATQVPLLGELLRQNGYRCAGVGKWHNGTRAFARSFDMGGAIFFGGMCDHFAVPAHAFDPAGTYPKSAQYTGDKHSTELFCDAATQCIAQYQRDGGDGPLFLYVAFTAPHDPRTTLPAWHAQYRPEDVVLPPNFWAQHPFDNGELNVRDEKLAAFPRNESEIRRHIADYCAMTAHMDDAIGRIHQAMARAGLAENTLFIHTADHGLAVGQHGLMGKQNLYEHSVRVPLLVQGPGFAAGRQDDRLCYQHDLFPTVLTAAGVPVPPNTHFQALQSNGSDRAHVGCAYRECQRMARDERFKLIEYRVGGGFQTQLFDLQADPWETQDISDQPAQQPVVARLRAQLGRWQQQFEDPCRDAYAS